MSRSSPSLLSPSPSLFLKLRAHLICIVLRQTIGPSMPSPFFAAPRRSNLRDASHSLAHCCASLRRRLDRRIDPLMNHASAHPLLASALFFSRVHLYDLYDLLRRFVFCCVVGLHLPLFAPLPLCTLCFFSFLAAGASSPLGLPSKLLLSAKSPILRLPLFCGARPSCFDSSFALLRTGPPSVGVVSRPVDPLSDLTVFACPARGRSCSCAPLPPPLLLSLVFPRRRMFSPLCQLYGRRLSRQAWLCPVCTWRPRLHRMPVASPPPNRPACFVVTSRRSLVH